MSQQYDEELKGATPTDAAEQGVVESSVDAPTDLPEDAAPAVDEEAAADSETPADEATDKEPAAEDDDEAAPGETGETDVDAPGDRSRSSVRRCAPRSGTGSSCTPTPVWRTG